MKRWDFSSNCSTLSAVILSGLLPFTESEMEFLNLVLDKGEITPELLTADENLQDRIRRHPLLEWKAVNVRAHKR